jgi:hypothetical protein
LIFSAFLQISLTVFIVYNIICVTLLIVDYFISQGEGVLAVERIGKENLSIFEIEEIAFSVYNKGNYKLNIELKDELPDFYFKVENPTKLFLERYSDEDFIDWEGPFSS